MQLCLTGEGSSQTLARMVSLEAYGSPSGQLSGLDGSASCPYNRSQRLTQTGADALDSRLRAAGSARAEKTKGSLEFAGKVPTPLDDARTQALLTGPPCTPPPTSLPPRGTPGWTADEHRGVDIKQKVLPEPLHQA